MSTIEKFRHFYYAKTENKKLENAGDYKIVSNDTGDDVYMAIKSIDGAVDVLPVLKKANITYVKETSLADMADALTLNSITIPDLKAGDTVKIFVEQKQFHSIGDDSQFTTVIEKATKKDLTSTELTNFVGELRNAAAMQLSSSEIRVIEGTDNTVTLSNIVNVEKFNIGAHNPYQLIAPYTVVAMVVSKDGEEEPIKPTQTTKIAWETAVYKLQDLEYRLVLERSSDRGYADWPRNIVRDMISTTITKATGRADIEAYTLLDINYFTEKGITNSKSEYVITILCDEKLSADKIVEKISTKAEAKDSNYTKDTTPVGNELGGKKKIV